MDRPQAEAEIRKHLIAIREILEQYEDASDLPLVMGVYKDHSIHAFQHKSFDVEEGSTIYIWEDLPHGLSD